MWAGRDVKPESGGQLGNKSQRRMMCYGRERPRREIKRRCRRGNHQKGHSPWRLETRTFAVATEQP